MERKPLDRGHQDKITRFKQEMVVIAENLSLQSRILSRIQLQSGAGGKMSYQRDLPRLGPSAAEPITTIYQTRRLDAKDDGYDLNGRYPALPRSMDLRTPQINRAYQPYGASYLKPERAVPQSNPFARDQIYENFYGEAPPPAYTPDAYNQRYMPEGSRALGSQIDPTDPSGIQEMFILESQAILSRKFRGFIELYDRASELEIWVCGLVLLILSSTY